MKNFTKLVGVTLVTTFISSAAWSADLGWGWNFDTTATLEYNVNTEDFDTTAEFELSYTSGVLTTYMNTEVDLQDVDLSSAEFGVDWSVEDGLTASAYTTVDTNGNFGDAMVKVEANF